MKCPGLFLYEFFSYENTLQNEYKTYLSLEIFSKFINTLFLEWEYTSKLYSLVKNRLTRGIHLLLT